jgi:hypothetical protein
MSASVAALSTPTPFGGVDTTKALERIYVQITALGNYAALGDTLDLTVLGDLIKSGYLPIFYYLQSQKAGGVSGYEYCYVPGTTLANGKFQVLQCAGAGNPMLDIGAGAYPAGVLADTIIGFFDFLRL